MEDKIFHLFPLLTHWRNKRYWTGFISVRTLLIRVAINVPQYPSVECATLSGDDDCRRLLSTEAFNRRIEKLMTRKGTLLELLELLSTVAEESLMKGLIPNKWNPDVYLSVFNDLQQIGLENISYVSENLDEVHVNQQDLSYRTHKIKFFIPRGYPSEDLRVEVDLPKTHEPIDWPKSMTASCGYFAKMLEKFDQFWTEMDEIDASIQVLDPFNPSRADTYRRILLSSKVILHIDVDPLTPRACPGVRFLGSTEAAAGFDAEFTRNIKKWSGCYSVLENLQALIESPLPAQGDNKLTEDDVKCVICYMYNLEGDFPETMCHCESFFHDKCLRELYVNEMSAGKNNAVDCPVCTLEIKF